jgi:hypothetical protein
MSNSRSSGTNHEYATVDSNPGYLGYFTKPFCPRDKVKTGSNKVFFSVRDATGDISAAPSALSDVTVGLQFKCPGDLDWTDYVPLDGSELAIGNRVALEDMGAGVIWRAGVVDDGYGGGSVVFGFDW